MNNNKKEGKEENLKIKLRKKKETSMKRKKQIKNLKERKEDRKRRSKMA